MANDQSPFDQVQHYMRSMSNARNSLDIGFMWNKAKQQFILASACADARLYSLFIAFLQVAACELRIPGVSSCVVDPTS